MTRGRLDGRARLPRRFVAAEISDGDVRPEIQTVAQVSGKSVAEVLAALKNAGQRTLPGGGACQSAANISNLRMLCRWAFAE